MFCLPNNCNGTSRQSPASRNRRNGCSNNILLVLSLDKLYRLSKGVGMGSPLTACSVYGDITRFVHTVNNLRSVSSY